MNPHPATTPPEPSLFPPAVDQAPAPRLVIEVPAAGLCEKLLREAIGAASVELNPLFGDQLGSPRDYSWPRGATAHVFTLAGVKRVVDLLHLPIDVRAEGQPVDAAAPVSTPPPSAPRRRLRGPWWQADQSED